MGGVRTYSLEHVMATLLDDVLFGYHEIGGTGVTTEDVIRYILARQTVTRWQLGLCYYTDQFQYHFENVSLLSALLSLGETIAGEYTWTFDTSTTPWTVSLTPADDEAGCGIHYGRNLVEIEKTMDASALVTRLYPLGYGEGVNQLTIVDANGGLPYIDADTASVWGIKCSVWTDTRIEDPATLLARARQVLDGYKNPYITYTASAVDLSRLTGYSWDEYMPGKLVRVEDAEHGITFDARIVEITKSDMAGDPGAIEITIANAPRDAADSINTLADRVGIGELYSQGATNLFAVPFADNADATHPAKMRVYLPSGLVRINKMLLSWQIAAFRSYVKGTESGGSTTSTSSSGGGGSVTSENSETMTQTSEDGGAATVTIPQVVLGSGETGGAYENKDENPSTMTVSGAVCELNGTLITSHTTDSQGSHSHTVNSHSHSIGSHSHTINDHKHSFNHEHNITAHDHTITSGASKTGGTALKTATPIKPSSGVAYGSTDNATISTNSASGSTGTESPGTNSQGAHTHSVPLHYHKFDHKHFIAGFTIPAQTINIPAHSHSVKLIAHTHKVSLSAHTHSVEIPNHTHGAEYGIYENGRANTVTIIVDGTTVPATDYGTGRELDVVPYLSKDQESGKILRNTWHEIDIVPDALTRIEANLFAQVFVQSVGGGNY